jgi:hypothetical protein
MTLSVVAVTQTYLGSGRANRIFTGENQMTITKIAIYYLHTEGTSVGHELRNDAELFLAHEFANLCRCTHVQFVDEDINEEVTICPLRISTLYNNPAWCSTGVNLMFRAVHDYHHYCVGSGFTLKGEIAAYKYGVHRYREHCQKTGAKFNRQVQALLYSEIVLQAATYFYLGDFPDAQKVVL